MVRRLLLSPGCLPHYIADALPETSLIFHKQTETVDSTIARLGSKKT